MSIYNKPKYSFATFLIAMFSIFAITSFSVSNKHILKTKNHYADIRKKYVLNKQTTVILHSDNFDKHLITEIKNNFRNIYSKISSTFNKKLQHPKISYNVYSSFEQKGLITKNTFFSSTNASSIHVVINNSIRSDDGFSIAKLIIENNFGNTNLKFIDDGLATYFSNKWRFKDYHKIAARLVKANEVPSLDFLLNNKMLEFESYLSFQPLGAVFIEFYINKFGEKSLIDLFGDTEQIKSKLMAMQSDWDNYLTKLLKKYSNRLSKNEETFNKSLPPFLKGFCFAHEGYQIYNGYISQSAVQSLTKLKELGTNSISITPFTGMRNPNKAAPLSIWRAAGTENDESVIFISKVAKKLGIIPVLKPHIYLHRSWPGAIKMSSEKEWNEFAENYFRWIKHYALLAQMYHIPLFVIGNELVEFTLSHPKIWREMIRKIRIIYDGKITYGSNWGKEFEQLTFWDDLDFIGISNYYPLSNKTNPTDEELLQGANHIIKRIEKVSKRFGKQIIFTEIGYRSSKAPWLTSNEDDKSKRTINNNSQYRAYNAVAKAIKNKSWLRGLFWWKWPSYLYYNTKRRHDLFTPMNKPAEQIVRKMFAQKQK